MIPATQPVQEEGQEQREGQGYPCKRARHSPPAPSAAPPRSPWEAPSAAPPRPPWEAPSAAPPRSPWEAWLGSAPWERACPVPLDEWCARRLRVLQARTACPATHHRQRAQQPTTSQLDPCHAAAARCRLHSLGLRSQLLATFQAHEVDELALPLLTGADLMVRARLQLPRNAWLHRHTRPMPMPTRCLPACACLPGYGHHMLRHARNTAAVGARAVRRPARPAAPTAVPPTAAPPTAGQQQRGAGGGRGGPRSSARRSSSGHWDGGGRGAAAASASASACSATAGTGGPLARRAS